MQNIKENQTAVFKDVPAKSLFDVYAIPNRGTLIIFLLLHAPENVTVQAIDEEKIAWFDYFGARYFLGLTAGKAKRERSCVSQEQS